MINYIISSTHPPRNRYCRPVCGVVFRLQLSDLYRVLRYRSGDTEHGNPIVNYVLSAVTVIVILLGCNTVN